MIIGNPEHYLVNFLKNKTFNLSNEKLTQGQIEKELTLDRIVFYREKRLSETDKPDFMIGDIAIEVKLKGSAAEIFRQCERYCSYSEVRVLILMCSRPMGIKGEINGKPIYLIDMGKSWL